MVQDVLDLRKDAFGDLAILLIATEHNIVMPVVENV